MNEIEKRKMTVASALLSAITVAAVVLCTDTTQIEGGTI